MTLKSLPLKEQQQKSLEQLTQGITSSEALWLSGYFYGLHQSLSKSDEQPANNPEPQKNNSLPLTILYGTHTGRSAAIAQSLHEKAQKLNIKSSVYPMDEYNVRQLKNEKNILVIVSTHGEGDPPLMAEDFYQYITGKRAPRLEGVKYSVLALGDKSYKHFCKTGIDIDRAFSEAGASPILPVETCDVDYEAKANQWIEKTLSILNKQNSVSQPIDTTTGDQSADTPPEYNRHNPFEAEILDKVRITGRESDKEVYHLEISLEGSGLTYEPGDALGVIAQNPRSLVEDILKELNYQGSEKVETHAGEVSLQEALEHHYEITVLTRDILEKYATLTQSEQLQELLNDDQQLETWLFGHDLLDLLHEFPYPIKAENLIQLLRPLPPRLYSISSSQAAVGEEVHITVSKVQFNNKGRTRVGACSGFLSENIEPGDKLLVYIEKNYNFRLPENGDPVIMIGAGTGIAPYRAFMQHRKTMGQKGNSWLFYGDRKFSSDFLYQTEWQKYLKEGILEKIDLAFSRDQEQKVYVQHRLLEKQEQLFQWIKKGAYIYLCGDRKKMAPDVEKTLTEIIQKQGGMTPEKAKEYLHQLKRQKRFKIDVY